MRFRDLHDYVIDSFRNTTDDIEEINDIPYFPTMEGEHHRDIIDNDEIYVEIITNPASPNHILFKVLIDNNWFYPQPKIFFFLRLLFNHYRERKIISVKFCQKINNNPHNCWVYFMIEFAS